MTDDVWTGTPTRNCEEDGATITDNDYGGSDYNVSATATLI